MLGTVSPLASMLHALLLVVGALAGIFLAALALFSLVIGLVRLAERRSDERRLAKERIESLRAWADEAFPIVFWDEESKMYLTEAELQARKRLAAPAPPSERPQATVTPVEPRPHRGRRHGFERRPA